MADDLHVSDALATHRQEEGSARPALRASHWMTRGFQGHLRGSASSPAANLLPVQVHRIHAQTPGRIVGRRSSHNSGTPRAQHPLSRARCASEIVAANTPDRSAPYEARSLRSIPACRSQIRRGVPLGPETAGRSSRPVLPTLEEFGYLPQHRGFGRRFPDCRQADSGQPNHGEAVLPVNSSLGQVIEEQLRHAPLHTRRRVAYLVVHCVRLGPRRRRSAPGRSVSHGLAS